MSYQLTASRSPGRLACVSGLRPMPQHIRRKPALAGGPGLPLPKKVGATGPSLLGTGEDEPRSSAVRSRPVQRPSGPSMLRM